MAATSSLTSDAGAVPCDGRGGGKGGTQTWAAGIPVKHRQFFLLPCPNLLLFFLGNAQGESKASEGRRAEMVGTQSSYVLLGVERGPGY